MEAGKTFEKTWTFVNEGTLHWPADSRLEHVSGVGVGELRKAISSDVKPGEHHSVTLKFTAPFKPGTYCSFYRMMHGVNKKFSKNVWCEINVKEGELPKDELPAQLVGAKDSIEEVKEEKKDGV